jgi:hypothetical protein
MTSARSAASETISRQRDHQVRFHRKQTRVLGWVFALGLLVSVLGLAPTLAWYREWGSPIGRAVFLSLSALYFGWGVTLWRAGPFVLRPRIVPYFARQVEEYGGTTSVAFKRGRALYQAIEALDRRAAALGVTPLSTFGFADDYYGQAVHWHEAASGLRSVEALRRDPGADLADETEVVADLAALAAALRLAADREIGFGLTLRLSKKDSLQVVSSMEERRGRFW